MEEVIKNKTFKTYCETLYDKPEEDIVQGSDNKTLLIKAVLNNLKCITQYDREGSSKVFCFRLCPDYHSVPHSATHRGLGIQRIYPAGILRRRKYEAIAQLCVQFSVLHSRPYNEWSINPLLKQLVLFPFNSFLFFLFLPFSVVSCGWWGYYCVNKLRICSCSSHSDAIPK